MKRLFWLVFEWAAYEGRSCGPHTAGRGRAMDAPYARPFFCGFTTPVTIMGFGNIPQNGCMRQIVCIGNFVEIVIMVIYLYYYTVCDHSM